MLQGLRIRHFLYFSNSIGNECMESGSLALDVGLDCGGIRPVGNLAGHHIQLLLDGPTHSHRHYCSLKFQSWNGQGLNRSKPCLSKYEGSMIGMILCFKFLAVSGTRGNF